MPRNISREVCIIVSTQWFNKFTIITKPQKEYLMFANFLYKWCSHDHFPNKSMKATKMQIISWHKVIAENKRYMRMSLSTNVTVTPEPLILNRFYIEKSFLHLWTLLNWLDLQLLKMFRKANIEWQDIGVVHKILSEWKLQQMVINRWLLHILMNYISNTEQIM